MPRPGRPRLTRTGRAVNRAAAAGLVRRRRRAPVACRWLVPRARRGCPCWGRPSARDERSSSGRSSAEPHRRRMQRERLATTWAPWSGHALTTPERSDHLDTKHLAQRRGGRGTVRPPAPRPDGRSASGVSRAACISVAQSWSPAYSSRTRPTCPPWRGHGRRSGPCRSVWMLRPQQQGQALGQIEQALLDQIGQGVGRQRRAQFVQPGGRQDR